MLGSIQGHFMLGSVQGYFVVIKGLCMHVHESMTARGGVIPMPRLRCASSPEYIPVHVFCCAC